MAQIVKQKLSDHPDIDVKSQVTNHFNDEGDSE